MEKENKMKEAPDGLIQRGEILKRWEVKDKTLLDIGVGPLAAIACRDFNCRVTNIDKSKDVLGWATEEARRENLPEKIRFEEEDATSLSYPKNSFQVVISYGTLHHNDLEKRGPFIEEVCRVAQEKAIIAELNQLGFKHFHSGDSYRPVDLDWLEKKLKSLGKVEKYSGKMMDVYICFIF